MTLREYEQKRNFKKTPEPRPRRSKKKARIFVVHKHAASRLHYDLRLEEGGVLKSWAVPKGPSLNPADKRLAVQVEDHPYDYKDFEGTIPEGEYGAGKVIVWDSGTYEPLVWKRGSLRFILRGKKLKGEFSLVRFRPPKNWLLIKKKDRFASAKDITKRDRSVKSSRRLPDLEKPAHIAFTHLDKIFWPKEKYTKGDTVAYYDKIAATILPYLKNRPMVMNRHPNGIAKPNFFQKDSRELELPHFVKTMTIRAESGKRVRYVICNNKETLLYLANLGCIEMNPFASRTKHLHKPDFLIIDLDPSGNSYDQIVKVALELRAILQKIGIENSFPKTSGKRGMHIYIPLRAAYSFDAARDFAKLLGALLQRRLPTLVSVEHYPAKRKGKIHPDYMRNALGQTAVAPYSLRPYPGATVSAPLSWSEVKSRLDPKKFTIKTIHRRLQKKGDLWKGVLASGADLTKAAKMLKIELLDEYMLNTGHR